MFPVKIVLPPNKSRILYFEYQDIQAKWASALRQAMGYSNVFDFYQVGANLGKGQFGLVKMAEHRRSG